MILHELVHYYLLLTGQQSKGSEQHNEIFQAKAREIEEITGYEGVTYGNNVTQAYLRYKHKHFLVLVIYNDDDDVEALRFYNEKALSATKQIINVILSAYNKKHYRFLRTNLQAFDDLDVIKCGEQYNFKIIPRDFFNMLPI